MAHRIQMKLGVVPDASMRKTFQRLMAHARPAEKSPSVTDPAVSRPGLAAAQLVGRSAELHVLQDVWRTAVAGAWRQAAHLAPGRWVGGRDAWTRGGRWQGRVLHGGRGRGHAWHPTAHLARNWLEQRLTEQGHSVDQLVLQESQNQAADQVSPR